jgi:hypothetical protein
VVLKLIAIKEGNWVLGIDTLSIVLIPYDSGIDMYRYRKLGISAKPGFHIPPGYCTSILFAITYRFVALDLRSKSEGATLAQLPHALLPEEYTMYTLLMENI